MKEEILSIFEGVITGVLIWKVFIPFFIELSKTSVGGWAYFGLVCFLIVVLGSEYVSYQKNSMTWIVSKMLGNS